MLPLAVCDSVGDLGVAMDGHLFARRVREIADSRAVPET
jgi:hypothetical protein